MGKRICVPILAAMTLMACGDQVVTIPPARPEDAAPHVAARQETRPPLRLYNLL